MSEAYTEDDLREAFKAGWKERDRFPGLKRQTKRSLNNYLRSAMGGGRFNDVEYVPAHRAYRHGYWLGSDFRKALANTPTPAGQTGRDPFAAETADAEPGIPTLPSKGLK